MDQETKTALRALSDHYNELRTTYADRMSSLTRKVETTYVETHHLATDLKELQDRVAKIEALDPTQRIEVLHTQVCDVVDALKSQLLKPANPKPPGQPASDVTERSKLLHPGQAR